MSIPLDGSPLVEADAAAIGDEFFSRCCVVPHSGAAGLDTTGSAINQNAFFDTARRFSKFIRFVDRYQLTGYEVTGGKSTLFFVPRDLGCGATVFDGIADQIRTTAPAAGWTNEWLVEFSFRPYSPHDTHIFGLPGFADYFDLWERGQWFAPDTLQNSDLLWHISYGSRAAFEGNFFAESVSGYNYARLATAYAGLTHMNQETCGGDPTCEAAKLAFYKSCPIYKTPYEIETCVSTHVGGQPAVKMTLTTRLQNTVGEVDGVPAGDVSGDVTTWDGPTLAAEPYRTDENAIRLYILNQYSGYNPTPTTGDCALNGAPYALYDSVFASIIPTILLVQLLPLPVDDGNDTAESTDSPTWHDWLSQAELYLRAMCEGYVDPRSTTQLGCNVDDPDGTPGTGDESCSATGEDLYDYTFENLVFDATDGALSAFATLPTTTTGTLTALDVVADPWPGYGPLPRTPRAAEGFNLFSACVNKLFRARLMLPYLLEVRQITYASDALAVPPQTFCEAAPGCGATGKNVWVGRGLPATTLSVDTGWVAWPGWDIHASIAAGFDNGVCIGADYQLTTSRQVVSFRFTLTDADSINAIPILWRNLATGDRLGTMFCVDRYDQNYRWNLDATTVCSGLLVFNCGFESEVVQSTECRFLRASTVDFGESPPSGLHATGWSGVGNCTYNPERHWWGYPVENRTLYVDVPIDGVTDIEQPEDLTL